ncbi:MAG: twin-arginine translocase TatA/TatE family subunit [Chloroflexota bacterium]
MPGLGPIGPFELVVILVIVVLIFGVGKLPEVGGALGKGIKEFKSNVTGEEEEKKKEASKETPETPKA